MKGCTNVAVKTQAPRADKLFPNTWNTDAYSVQNSLAFQTHDLSENLLDFLDSIVSEAATPIESVSIDAFASDSEGIFDASLDCIGGPLKHFKAEITIDYAPLPDTWDEVQLDEEITLIEEEIARIEENKRYLKMDPIPEPPSSPFDLEQSSFLADSLTCFFDVDSVHFEDTYSTLSPNSSNNLSEATPDTKLDEVKQPSTKETSKRTRRSRSSKSQQQNLTIPTTITHDTNNTTITTVSSTPHTKTKLSKPMKSSSESPSQPVIKSKIDIVYPSPRRNGRRVKGKLSFKDIEEIFKSEQILKLTTVENEDQNEDVEIL